MRRNRLVVALALAVAMAMTAVAAQAADIGGLSSRIFSVSAPVTYPTAERSITAVTLSTSGTTITGATVTVTGTALSTLNGQSATLVLLDSANAQLASAVATLATGSNLTVGSTTATITLSVAGSVPSASATGWAVFIAGVQVLNPSAPSTVRTVALGNGTFPVVVTTWQDALIDEANTNVTISNLTMTTNTTDQQCFAVSVTGTSSTPTAWALNLDWGAAPFWGTQPSQIQKAQVQSTTGTVWRLVGLDNGNGPYEEWANNDLLSNTQTLVINICQYASPIPPNRTEAYTVGAQFNGTWNSGKACISRTITGNNKYPFYFGWSVAFDATAAMAYLRGFDPGSPDAIEYTPNPYTPALTQSVTTYTMTNARPSSIKAAETYTATLCFMNY